MKSTMKGTMKGAMKGPHARFAHAPPGRLSVASGGGAAPLKGLWIARALPFPLDTGDRIYAANLLKALAGAGADLTAVGFAAEVPVPSDWPVRWVEVAGRPRGTLPSLASVMPLVAASHATREFRRSIDTLAREHWDFVVFDHYGTGWAIDAFRRHAPAGNAPVLVHVAHDHEASVYASLVRGFKGSRVKRLGLAQNWWKTARLERGIARTVDLVTAITPEDAARFERDAPHTGTVVLTPGYTGAVSQRTRIAPDVPRRVIMVGNYRWVAKSENLRQFVAAADGVFHRHGIELHVVGSIDDAQAAEIRGSTRATVVHGFVDDVMPLFEQARMAVVPEVIGGGFKLKYLDYIFGRMPVASLEHAMAGLPDTIRRAMVCRDDLASLTSAIVERIDDVDALNAMQAAALAAAEALFQWEDRGRALVDAITAQRARRRGATAAASAASTASTPAAGRAHAFEHAPDDTQRAAR